MNHSDIDGNRVFPYEIQLPLNNTAEDCLNLCAEYGYGAGGMEYSVQCCKPSSQHPF